MSLAAQLGRHAILERLLELCVDASVVDEYGKSPLLYATANSDSRCVSTLLENGAQPNDGSLHEAARLCQEAILVGLLKSGHDPDYSSHLHEGRTALGELCSQASIKLRGSISSAYETMTLLIRASSDLGFRTKEGKTVLHLAIDNEEPLEITRVLLRFPEIYKDLRTDSERFLFKDEQGRYMSPDIYAKRYCRSGEINQSQLIALLAEKCKTKWFTKASPQLADYQGLPPALEAIQKQQDLADQAEQREIERRQRSAKADLEISEKHHRATMIQSKEQADLSLFNTQRMNDQQIAHDSRIAVQRRANLNLEREDERHHIKESNRLTYAATQERNQLEYSSRQQIQQLEYSSRQRMQQLEYSSQAQKDQQRYSALEKESALQKKMLESQEAAEIRHQARALERSARHDASVRLEAQERRALIAAAKDARVDSKLPALTWNEQPD